MYIAEISPERRRGGFVALFQLAITVGIFLAYVVNYAFASIQGWRWMFLSAIVPALVLFAGVLVLPRSPRWLALVGREKEAREVLASIGEGDADQELAEIEASFEHGQASWRELLAPLARNALLVGLGLGIFQQFIGINTVIYYAPTILQFSGFQVGHRLDPRHAGRRRGQRRHDGGGGAADRSSRAGDRSCSAG